MALKLEPVETAILILLIIVILLIIIVIIIIVFVILHFRRRRQGNAKKIVKWKEGVVEVMEVNKLEDGGDNQSSQEREKDSRADDKTKDELCVAQVETAADVHLDSDVVKHENNEDVGEAESDSTEKEKDTKDVGEAELGETKESEASCPVKMEDDKVSGDKTEHEKTKQDELPDKAAEPEAQQNKNNENEVAVKPSQAEPSVTETSPPASSSGTVEEQDSKPEAKVVDGVTQDKDEKTVEKSPPKEIIKEKAIEQDLKTPSDLPENKDSAT